MTQAMQRILTQIMGTYHRGGWACPGSAVILKSNAAQMKALAELKGLSLVAVTQEDDDKIVVVSAHTMQLRQKAAVSQP